jgi:Flp pilus assembly pilin Flp
MIRMFRKFRKDEDGAVTVDWVVLTAAVVALAGAAYVAIQEGTSSLSENIQEELQSITVDSDGAGDGS